MRTFATSENYLVHLAANNNTYAILVQFNWSGKCVSKKKPGNN